MIASVPAPERAMLVSVGPVFCGWNEHASNIVWDAVACTMSLVFEVNVLDRAENRAPLDNEAPLVKRVNNVPLT